MFGYVTINRRELKVKDLDTYQAYYCGLCQKIRRRFGLLESGALNFDMTFLSLLLSSLYEEKTVCKKERCFLHPFCRRQMILTEAGSYAADMNFLIFYHELADDWIDEKKLWARVLVGWLHKKYKKTAARYPRQHKALLRCVRKLRECEKSGRQDIEEAASVTGRAIAEIYVREEDVWSEYLRRIGYYIGKFTYLMDAYEDVEKDKKSGSYNPLQPLYESGLLEERIQEYLELLLGECCRAFEMLPIIENIDILRNILYSGVWMKFAQIAKKRRQEAEGKNKDGSI